MKLFEKNKTYTDEQIEAVAFKTQPYGVSISAIDEDYSTYLFHPTERGFMLFEIDGKEVNPAVRHEGRRQYFVVRKDHIQLLKHFWFRWELTAYNFGVPCVDVKRPYGNSGILGSIIDILNLPYCFDEDLDGYPDEIEAELRQLHHETLIALQILVRNAHIEPGEYVADSYSQNWQPLKHPDKWSG